MLKTFHFIHCFLKIDWFRWVFNQVWAQIRVSTILRDNELLKGSKTRPPVLKANSKAAVDTGIAMKSHATSEKITYLVEFTFHQAKISKPSLFFSLASLRYLSTSVVHSLSSSVAMCSSNSCEAIFHRSCGKLALDSIEEPKLVACVGVYALKSNLLACHK